MPRRPIGFRKRRTREHVIAELGINFVERQALLCGFSVEQVAHDYGVDLFLFTYDQSGFTQTAWIPIQVKATDRLQFTRDRDFVVFRVDVADLRSWFAEPFPVILVVYDAKSDTAYWLYIQKHFGDAKFRVSRALKRMTIRIPISQVLNPDAVRTFAVFRDEVLSHWREEQSP